VVPEWEYEERWEKAFRKVPAPPREGPEPHNAGSENFGERTDANGEPQGFALLLGKGYVPINPIPDRPKSDHLPGGAFHKSDGFYMKPEDLPTDQGEDG
jgi:hypothetical protein